MGGRARRAIGWVAPLLFFAACFSEPPLEDGKGGTTTGEAECPMGGSGCACNGNGTCDGGLECAAVIDVCVPAGCTAGTEACICLGPDCLTGLACDGGVCVVPLGDSGGEVSSSSSSDEGGTTLGANGVTGSTTGEALDSTSAADAGTTGASNCWFDGEGCDECQTCIDDVVAGGECTVENLGCTGDCVLLRECHTTNESTGQCCLDHGESVGEYHALVCCALTLCPSCMETLCTQFAC